LPLLRLLLLLLPLQPRLPLRLWLMALPAIVGELLVALITCRSPCRQWQRCCPSQRLRPVVLCLRQFKRSGVSAGFRLAGARVVHRGGLWPTSRGECAAAFGGAG